MAQPTSSDVHVDRPLTNISIAFLQGEEKYIAIKAAPVVPVDNQSDVFFTYTKGDWFRSAARERSPGSESAGSGFNITTDSYFSKVIAVHKDIDDVVRANATAPIQTDRDATEFVTGQLALKREKDWATTFFKTGVWTGDQTGVSASPSTNEFLQWDVASSTPIDDIDAQMDSIEELTSFRPNAITFGPKTWTTIKNHPDIIDRIKGGATTGNAAIANERLVAQVLGLSEVSVARATENTAVEGATESFSYIHGKAALLYYKQPAPGLLKPSAMYTYVWRNLPGAGPQGQRISKFRLEQLRSDRLEGEMTYAQKVIAADLATFFASAIG